MEGTIVQKGKSDEKSDRFDVDKSLKGISQIRYLLRGYLEIALFLAFLLKAINEFERVEDIEIVGYLQDQRGSVVLFIR